ncbi:transglutaminase family protein, partial [Aquabacterium soli]
YANKGTRLTQVGNSLEGLEFVTPPEPGVAPTAADLAETPETQRTAAIKAKALELGNNPVNIQNWVRNNVEWVPTWGAIQSAQDTLDKKRGNAIDIASLEIALLRAAKIPARYQFGTIELPAEQVMNWVGGVSKPEAAQQLLGQGGIANRGLIEGGRISKIRMEHAWVQAYVNWLPSRGAKQGSATQHPSPQGQRNA